MFEGRGDCGSLCVVAWGGGAYFGLVALKVRLLGVGARRVEGFGWAFEAVKADEIALVVVSSRRV